MLPRNLDKVTREYNAVVMSNEEFRRAQHNIPRNANLRLVARVPLAAATIHPEVKKYICTQANSQDLKKEVDLLLKRFPEFDMRVKRDRSGGIG